jgi:hypothetical protein
MMSSSDLFKAPDSMPGGPTDDRRPHQARASLPCLAPLLPPPPRAPRFLAFTTAPPARASPLGSSPQSAIITSNAVSPLRAPHASIALTTCGKAGAARGWAVG